MAAVDILIAESSRVQYTLMEKHLSTHYVLTIAKDGNEALQHLKEGKKFPIMILDLGLPIRDGFELLQFIKETKIEGKILVITNKPRKEVEKSAIEQGADYLMTTPLDFELLIALLTIWSKKESKKVKLVAQTDDSGNKFPFSTVSKCCYICGYEDVKIHLPIEEAYEESWEAGIFPEYRSHKGYESWDFLRTMVFVCPYCFFASSHSEDFSDIPDQPFPYKVDAKRILSRTMSTRKRFVSGPRDVDKRFDDPRRDKDLVISSFKLAEKCMNGLILGEKKGTHCQLGYYHFLLGALDKTSRDTYYFNALESFNNHLKLEPERSALTTMAYFFIIVIKMATGHSEEVKTMVDKVVSDYGDKKSKDLQPLEKTWLKRIIQLWQSGLISEKQRELN